VFPHHNITPCRQSPRSPVFAAGVEGAITNMLPPQLVNIRFTEKVVVVQVEVPAMGSQETILGPLLNIHIFPLSFILLFYVYSFCCPAPPFSDPLRYSCS